MGTGDRAENNTDKAKGNIKETVGKATDNDRLQNEGRSDQTKGNLKNAVEDVKDAFSNKDK